MGLHAGQQNLGRKLEIGLVEIAQHGQGIFHQIGHMLNEPVIPGNGPADLPGQFVTLGNDHGHTVVMGQNHLTLLTDHIIIQVRLLHLEGARTEHAVTAGRVPGIEPCNDKGHDLPVKQSQKPPQRTAEGEPGCFPVHLLGKGKMGDHVLADFSENFGGRFPAHHLVDGQILALARVRDIDVLHLHLLGPGKTESCLGGLALIVKGDPGRGTRDNDLFPLLHLGHVRAVEHQTPGRGQGGYRAMSQFGLGKTFGNALFQGLVQYGQKPGRHLFCAYFQNKMGHIS